MGKKKHSFILFLWFVSFYLSSFASAFRVNSKVKDSGIFGDDDDHDDDSKEDDCGWICQEDGGLSDGEIAAIVISVVIAFFGIPILLCFCCAWCCFRGRRKRVHKTQIVAVAAPIVPQQPRQHQYQYSSTQNPSTINPSVGNYNYTYASYQQPTYPVSHANGQGQTSTTPSPYPRQQYANVNPPNNYYEQPPPYFEAVPSAPPSTSIPPIHTKTKDDLS